MEWDVVNEFFKTPYGKGMIKQASHKKRAFDQDSYYETNLQGPTVPDEIAVAHPGGGTNTQVANSGGGGEGLYDVSMSDVSATGPSADAHVDTVSEMAPIHEEVARKQPTGQQASRIKGLAKKSSPSQKVRFAKRTLLAKLVRLADELDEKGLTDEARQIDEIIAEETGAEAELETVESQEPDAEGANKAPKAQTE